MIASPAGTCSSCIGRVPLRGIAKNCGDCLRTFAAAMLCASNMSALIPPVAPPFSAAERLCPSHHTLGLEALAALLDVRGRKPQARTPQSATLIGLTASF